MLYCTLLCSALLGFRVLVLLYPLLSLCVVNKVSKKKVLKVEKILAKNTLQYNLGLFGDITGGANAM